MSRFPPIRSPPGTFYWPSTLVEGMYEPEVFGRTASTEVKIELTELYGSAFSFWLILLGMLALVTYFPALFFLKG